MNGMKIVLGSDRRGFRVKERLVAHLQESGYEVLDAGPYDGEAELGVVICATGNGILMAANKVKGARCGMGYADDVARLMREHNDANIICFGQDYMAYEDIERRLDIFLDADFIGDYHCSRVQQLFDIENGKAIRQTAMKKRF